jgi:methionyl-tRNA formyltransferase
MKVVILTSNTPSNVWLVNQILARHEVSAMVIEAPPLARSTQEKRARRRRMRLEHGLARTLNKLAYNALRWRILSPVEGKSLRRHFFPGNAEVAYLRAVPRVTVANINDPVCVDLIKQHRPDVLAVCGTSVIRPEVFALAPRGTLNIHTGITPEYRSADPIFWALYHDELDKVGVTVHFIDQGIDTGPIIYQESVPLYAGDNLASITARCIRRGAALYLKALEELERGAVRTLDRSGVRGRAFYSIDLGLVQYLLFCWRLAKLQPRLPRAPETDLDQQSKPAARSAGLRQ